MCLFFCFCCYLKLIRSSVTPKISDIPWSLRSSALNNKHLHRLIQQPSSKAGTVYIIHSTTTQESKDAAVLFISTSPAPRERDSLSKCYWKEGKLGRRSEWGAMLMRFNDPPRSDVSLSLSASFIHPFITTLCSKTGIQYIFTGDGYSPKHSRSSRMHHQKESFHKKIHFE